MPPITAACLRFLLDLGNVPPGRAAQVVALNRILTLLFAMLLFRDRVNWVMRVGVVLAITGALFALSDGLLSALMPSKSGAGELLLLGCAGCWVAYNLIGRMVLTSLDSLTTTAAIGAAAAYISLVPLFGLIFSSLWLGEALTISLLIGGAMAITGMLLMNLGRMQMEKPGV